MGGKGNHSSAHKLKRIMHDGLFEATLNAIEKAT
jgi:hypothetical protein